MATMAYSINSSDINQMIDNCKHERLRRALNQGSRQRPVRPARAQAVTIEQTEKNTYRDFFIYGSGAALSFVGMTYEFFAAFC